MCAHVQDEVSLLFRAFHRSNSGSGSERTRRRLAELRHRSRRQASRAYVLPEMFVVGEKSPYHSLPLRFLRIRLCDGNLQEFHEGARLADNNPASLMHRNSHRIGG